MKPSTALQKLQVDHRLCEKRLANGWPQFHLHMSTVSRLLNARGGLSRLGLNGFLARLLVFIDTNSAALLGTRPYLRSKTTDSLPIDGSPLSGATNDTATMYQDRNETGRGLNLARFIGFMDTAQTTRGLGQ
jgi:hypothetical protein